MKNFQIIVAAVDRATPMDASEIFALSDHISEIASQNFHHLLGTSSAIDEKLNDILKQKKAINQILRLDVVRTVLNEYFYVDGAIKFNEADLEELNDALVVIGEDGRQNVEASSEFFENYMLDLIGHFCYLKGSCLVFRGAPYYFLFNGLRFDMKNRTSSINDYVIEDIDIELFSAELLAHYNTTQQYIQTFSTYFIASFHRDLKTNKEEFCECVKNALADHKLNVISQKIYSGELSIGSVNFDQMNLEKWTQSLEQLKHFRGMVEYFHSDDSRHVIAHIIEFLSKENGLFEHVKIEFGIDIDAIFNKFLQARPTKAMRKVLLGLLDAKINILAFFQNQAQILFSDQFLNPDFPGSLIFPQDLVRHIKKTCPTQFAAFKELQRELKVNEVAITLLKEVDEHVGFYMDALFEDNNLSYTKLIGLLPSDLQEITEGETSDIPVELEDAVILMKSFFNLLNAYFVSCEERAKSSEAKKIKQGKTYKKPETHLRAKRMALKKLIRIYREENDPLVMIKTAQNALNTLIEKGFQPDEDVLHIMSVNYGGTLVGPYAKHTFARTVKKGRVLSNTGGLVYSIYDVQNANTFSALTDYPFSRIMKDSTITTGVKKKLEEKNWLLVFDDNTNSGQTLDDIRCLAEASGFYGRIDLFPCRASTNLINYKKTITDEQKLAMIANSALATRRAKVNPEQARYKELLGTIVGNRLSKLLRPRLV